MTYESAQPVSGTVKAHLTDGTTDVPVLDSAPASDTGQPAVPVRVISQLGAGGGGGAASSVTINDPVTPAQKLAIDATGKIGVTGPLTDVQLRASAVPVSGFPATQKVRQTDGALDLTLLDAAPGSDTGQVAVPVRVVSQLGAGGGGGAASSVTVNDPTTPAQKLAVDAAGKIGINNFPATQPVSGPLTDTQLRASAVPVSGAFYQGTQPVSAAALPLPAGASTEATLALIKAKTDNLDVLLSTRTKPADLQAENVSQWGGAATTLGQKAMAASVPVVISSDQSTIPTKAFQAVTFTAIYRLAARPYALSNAFGAAGRKQYATIHHAATATKTVKLKRVEVALESSSAAAIIVADLVRITAAPATPNPSITAAPQNPGDGGAESTCMALPTTAGTEGAVHSFLEWNLGITGAASVLNPPPALNWYTLWPQVQGAGEVLENKYPTIRALTLEGFAVTLDSNAISTVKGYVVIEFSEE